MGGLPSLCLAAFRPGYILVDRATEDTAEWLMIIVCELPGWREAELSTCVVDNISRVYMEMDELLKLVIIQN